MHFSNFGYDSVDDYYCDDVDIPNPYWHWLMTMMMTVIEAMMTSIFLIHIGTG